MPSKVRAKACHPLFKSRRFWYTFALIELKYTKNALDLEDDDTFPLELRLSYAFLFPKRVESLPLAINQRYLIVIVMIFSVA